MCEPATKDAWLRGGDTGGVSKAAEVKLQRGVFATESMMPLGRSQKTCCTPQRRAARAEDQASVAIGGGIAPVAGHCPAFLAPLRKGRG